MVEVSNQGKNFDNLPTTLIIRILLKRVIYRLWH